LDIQHSVSGLGKCKGETDLFVDFLLCDGRRLRVMIENKVNAQFMPNQLGRYKERGQLHVGRNECEVFIHGLIASESYLSSKHNHNNDQSCDFVVSYEKIRDYFDHAVATNDYEKKRYFYRYSIMDQAITKSRRGYKPIHDEGTANFQVSLYKYIKKHFADISMENPEGKEIPRESKFIKLNSPKLNSYPSLPPQVLRLKFRKSKETEKPRVNIELKGMNSIFDVLKPLIKPLLNDGMVILPTGKSLSISMEIPVIDQRLKFNTQLKGISAMLTNTCKLLNWLYDNHEKLAVIIKQSI
jgi:hypothetical protein